MGTVHEVPRHNSERVYDIPSWVLLFLAVGLSLTLLMAWAQLLGPEAPYVCVYTGREPLLSLLRPLSLLDLCSGQAPPLPLPSDLGQHSYKLSGCPLNFILAGSGIPALSLHRTHSAVSSGEHTAPVGSSHPIWGFPPFSQRIQNSRAAYPLLPALAGDTLDLPQGWSHFVTSTNPCPHPLPVACDTARWWGGGGYHSHGVCQDMPGMTSSTAPARGSGAVCLGLPLVFFFGHQQLSVWPTDPTTTQITICGCKLPALRDTVHFSGIRLRPFMELHGPHQLAVSLVLKRW